MESARHYALAVGLVAGPLTLRTPASAALLVEVTGFGPTRPIFRMHLYVPDQVASHPRVLVAAHWSAQPQGPEWSLVQPDPAGYAFLLTSRYRRS